TGFHAVRQPAGNSRLHDEAVDDHVNVVLFITCQLNLFINGFELAIDADTREALAFYVLEYFLVGPFTLPNNGREELDFGAFGQGLNRIHYLLRGLRLDWLAALVTMRFANAREEQPQVIVDLCDGAYGRARIAVRGFLFN